MIIHKNLASALADALPTEASKVANCFEVIPPRKWLWTRTIKAIRAPAASPNLLVIFISKLFDFGAIPNSIVLNDVFLLIIHILRQKASKSPSFTLSIVALAASLQESAKKHQCGSWSRIKQLPVSRGCSEHYH
jgi:hypothetical protein